MARLVEYSKNPDFLEYVEVFSDVITAPKLQSCLNAYDLTTSLSATLGVRIFLSPA